MVEPHSADTIKPMPDPTVLTTEALYRESERIIKILSAEMKGDRDLNEVARNALSDHFNGRYESLESSRNELLEGMRREFDVRFANIKDQFESIEKWRIEQKSDTSTAVQAALNAAKEAVKQQTETSEKAIAKSEASTVAQAQQQNATSAAKFSALDATLADVKERVVKMENLRLGAAENHANSRLDMGTLFGLIGAMVAVISVIYAVTR